MHEQWFLILNESISIELRTSFSKIIFKVGRSENAAFLLPTDHAEIDPEVLIFIYKTKLLLLLWEMASGPFKLYLGFIVSLRFFVLLFTHFLSIYLQAVF